MADTSARLGEARLGAAVLASNGTPPNDYAHVGDARIGRAQVGATDMPDTTRSPDRFTWEGQCWERIVDPDLDIALVRGENTLAQEQLAARLANILRINVQDLYVTKGATISEAVIGQLWSDMFTARKIQADEIATNAITANKIVAESVTAGKIVASDELSAKVGKFMKVTTNMLIAGDAKITNELIAGEITGDKLTAGSITGDKIAADAIAAEKIAGGSFTGKTFVGGKFQGAEFQAPADPRWNGGIAIDPTNGLRGWNTDGDLTFHLSATDGSVDISANLRALNSANRGMMLIPTASTGGGGLWFTDTGRADSKSAAIWRAAYNPDELEPLNVRGANGGPVRVYGGLNTADAGIVSAESISTAKNLIADVDLIGYRRLTLPNLPDASGTANLMLTTSGNVGKITSSRRYKKNIVDWSPTSEQVLKLRPRQWQHNSENPVDPVDERWYVGFIAEEVHDAGLTGLVIYDGDGHGGWRPDALAYDRFAAAHQIVLKDHETRIHHLEEQLAALMTEGNH